MYYLPPKTENLFSEMSLCYAEILKMLNLKILIMNIQTGKEIFSPNCYKTRILRIFQILALNPPKNETS